MFKMVCKNLTGQFKKQRMLTLLLIMNIVVSCLVICFSYGLYRNFHNTLSQGEEESITYLNIETSKDNITELEDAPVALPAADISLEDIAEIALAFDDDVKNAIDHIGMLCYIKTPLLEQQYYDEASMEEYVNNTEVDAPYSDDLDPCYEQINISFDVKGDSLLPCESDKKIFTQEEFDRGEKVVAVGRGFYDPINHYAHGFTNSLLMVGSRKIPEDTDHIIINGEEYKIKRIDDRDILSDDLIRIPYTSVPEDLKISVEKVFEAEDYFVFDISFTRPITHSIYDKVAKTLEEATGGKFYLEPIEFTDVKELQYYRTVMLISVVIAVLAAINMAILYRYILEKRTSQLAIFRICGCTKGRAVLSYLIECLVINIPLFAITELIYHKLIMPHLSGLFPYMEQCYSFKLYAAIFGIYIVASMLVMLIMITLTVKKHSLVTLKSAPKSTGKMGVMKLFEVLQIAAVLAIMIMITSAITARYEMYASFSDMIERKGLMLTLDNFDVYPEQLEEVLGGKEYIANQFSNTYDGDTPIDGIAYSDEYINAYKPPLQDGVWLDEAGFTYADSGYIPVVVTSCGGRYKVGDVIENDIIMSYDENNEPADVINVKYKIIGVLRDKVNIAGYSYDQTRRGNFADLYSVFSDDFEDNDWFLSKISDEYACFGANGCLHGQVFIYCDGMSDDEIAQLKSDIVYEVGAVPVELSQVYDSSMQYIYEQMYTLFPIAVCIFILTIISTVSISAIYTKRQLRNYAIFYICGARWRTCALRSLKNSAITCGIAAAISAIVLIVGKLTLLKETVISFGWWHIAVCAGVIVLYLALSMIMPLMIIGSNEPKEVLKEE